MFFLMNNKQEIIESIHDSEVVEATKKEELKGTITAEVLFKRNVYDKINDKAAYIAFKDEDVKYSEKIQVFKILNNGLRDKSRVLAIHMFFDDLKHSGYVRDRRLKGIPLSVALDAITENTDWTYQTHTIANGSANWYDKDYLECFKDFINNWGVECDFEIQFKNNKVVQKIIHVYKKLGSDTGRRVVYKHNTSDMEIIENKSGIYTALSGRGKGEEKTDEEGESTGGYGRKIQFTDVEWAISKGDPLNKPRGQNFLEDPEATKMYGFKNGQPRLGIIEFSECEDPAELLELTYNALKLASRPQFQVKATMQVTGNLFIGDYVNVVRKDIGLTYKARVIEIKRNLLNGKLSDVVLGDHFFTSADKQRQELKAKFDSINDSLANFATKVENDLKETERDILKELQEGLTGMMYDDDAYNYMLAKDNEYRLPAGFYMFNRPIGSSPSKAMYIGGGKFAISNKKDSQGNWIWTTFGTGDGFVADNIVAGSLKGGRVDFNLTNGTFKIGSTLSNYPLLDYDGETLRLGRNSAKEIKVERNGDVKLPKIGETDIENYAITETKISSGAITTPKIASNSIGTNELKANSVTANEIASNTITAQNIKTGAITTDFLYPGQNERIVLEKGYSPGSNVAKSIDATGKYIRLKYNDRNYVRVGADGVSIFTDSDGGSSALLSAYGISALNGNFRTLGAPGHHITVRNGFALYVDNETRMTVNSSGNMWLRGGLEQWSDISLKSNIKYLDSNYVIKKRDKEELPLTVSDCTNFIKKCKTATYFYEPLEKSNLGIIAQDVKKFSNISKYMITTDKKDNKLRINTFPYITVLHTALQAEMKRSDKLEEKNKELEKRVERLEQLIGNTDF